MYASLIQDVEDMDLATVNCQVASCALPSLLLYDFSGVQIHIWGTRSSAEMEYF